MALNPLITHPLLSGVYTAALGMGASFLGVTHAPLIAAVIVSTFYYGREAGQREHDLKHMTPPKGALVAWAGSTIPVLWGLDNLAQWGVAAVSTALVGFGLTLAGY